MIKWFRHLLGLTSLHASVSSLYDRLESCIVNDELDKIAISSRIEVAKAQQAFLKQWKSDNARQIK